MGGLFGGGGTISTTAERIAAIQIQTSSYGGCLPIVYGTNRVPANLIDYADFTAIPHTTTQSGGKGGGGTSVSNTTYTYTAGLSSNISATVAVTHNFGEIPDAVIAQITNNARLVVAVKSVTATQATIEFFNPSPSSSSSSCTVQLIAFKAIS